MSNIYLLELFSQLLIPDVGTTSSQFKSVQFVLTKPLLSGKTECEQWLLSMGENEKDFE